MSAGEGRPKDRERAVLEQPWRHAAEEVLAALGSGAERGLASSEAAARLAREGPNRLLAVRPRSAARVLADQLRSAAVVLLLGAAALGFAFGGREEGAAVLVVVLLNTAIGFATELRAVRSMDALRSLGTARTRVRRDGRAHEIRADEVVRGDVLVLEGGDVVVADARVVRASRLEADESTFTGESAPVEKDAAPLADGRRVDERRNFLFKGTSLTRGSCEAAVVATGMRTELGRITALTQAAEPETTPLERQLARLASRLIWVTLGIVAAIALSGIAAGKPPLLMVETGVALAVATIPEGLPIVATIALARGLWRMARRNALINRLAAVETLGATTVIGTDKTGTLTENRMHVARLHLSTGEIEVDRLAGEGAPPLRCTSGPVDAAADPVLRAALEAGVLCNNASPGHAESGAPPVGDPLELALLAAAALAEIDVEALLAREPRVEEAAFDSVAKRMATVHATSSGSRVAAKGAPESLLDSCTSVRVAAGNEPLGAAERAAWLERARALAADGLRVLLLAERRDSRAGRPIFEDLALLGLVALLDPPRRDVAGAIAACRAAGIRVVVLTGDHPATAAHVARAVGLAGEGAPEVVRGEELERIDSLSAERREVLRRATVFARVDPAQKLHLVRLHQRAGEVVAMIGDGVNDAPALRKADIGVAMGRRGTQVAREAADMVLTDDSLASVVAAVEEGRAIFGNIRRFAVYLLSCNASEVLVVAIAAAVDAPLPILPLQILYLNLVSDVFPALALGMGEAAPGTLLRPPRRAGEGILTRRHAAVIAVNGLLLTAAVLAVFALALGPLELEPERAVTIAFLALAFAQLWHVFEMRGRRSRFWRNEVTRNPHVWGALLLCTLLLLAAVYVPWLREVLELVPLGGREWLLVAAGSLAPLALGLVLRPRRRVAARRSAG